ncbi:RIP metalloprotease RseP [Candidatus Formimonas warabiya]|uniref:Zinc metalloprotease n=1 Tax=Formimonas warabiya TaxID=1761012 RepID=A0A3G1KPZ4_FORW1|nr:RIP metalloprotease RseP [Candidatus Formimonas warabiya]ATW24534.1 RIP metalloprotease RseP [Candidatus Formimonas warabiya]
MSILWSIVIFGILILVHEFGHFITAKANDVKVDEFSLGMGPKVFGFQKGETIYSLRLLPLGGFVRMAGMEDQDQDQEEPRGFNKKTVLQRMAIIFAGPLMNFIAALALFILAFMVVGVPSNSNIIGEVVSGQPAAAAGIRSGDRIVEINGAKVENWEDIVTVIHEKPGHEITLTLSRDNQVKTVQVTPRKDPSSGYGVIGIMQSWERKGLFSATVLGLQNAYDFTKLIIVSLVQMITGAIAPDVAGPVGVVKMVGEVSRFGLGSLMTFAGILSINLGLINLFPIPALDGSRLVFLSLEGLRGRPIDPAKENFIHMIGFVLLMALMVVITYQDILRLFS